MRIELTGEIALATGASRGIGQQIALTLGKAGATVIGTATSEAGAQSISEMLEKNQINGQGLVVDIADADSVEKLMTQLKTQPPTILVNNAAVTRDNLLIRMKDEEWDTVINTDLNGVYRLSKACLRSMTKARKGRIISLTSVVGLTGNPGQANYTAAKAGVIGFTKSLAREIGTRGITVNAIAPGFIETDMTQAISTEQRETLIQQIPLGRPGTPEDVAMAVLFLASPLAAYITGETLHINGGMYMA